MLLGNAIPDRFANPGISGLSLLNPGIPGLIPGAAEAERLFSELERTLTATRNTMDEQKLEALILLQVHRSNTPAVDAVIDRFAATAARRLDFIL